MLKVNFRCHTPKKHTFWEIENLHFFFENVSFKGLNNICVLSWYIFEIAIVEILDLIRNMLFQSFTPSKTIWEKILCGSCFVIECRTLLFRIKSLSERSCWFIEYVVKPYYSILFKSTYKSLTIDFFTLDEHFGKAMSIY